mmetsp:Transcript_80531/g.240032  ORF Transcript_80531/g.240032 Transcript_80531/m.240032 type:complete len:253 (-) Transcript_80531:190-948(-)
MSQPRGAHQRQVLPGTPSAASAADVQGFCGVVGNGPRVPLAQGNGGPAADHQQLLARQRRRREAVPRRGHQGGQQLPGAKPVAAPRVEALHGVVDIAGVVLAAANVQPHAQRCGGRVAAPGAHRADDLPSMPGRVVALGHEAAIAKAAANVEPARENASSAAASPTQHRRHDLPGATVRVEALHVRQHVSRNRADAPADVQPLRSDGVDALPEGRRDLPKSQQHRPRVSAAVCQHGLQGVRQQCVLQPVAAA